MIPHLPSRKLICGDQSANINWVKDIYLEQEFEVVIQFLLTSDSFMSDLLKIKKKKSKKAFTENELLIIETISLIIKNQLFL
jgi:hypothetical protein